MSADYYSTEPRRRALRLAAWRWLGTPFRAHSMVCGAGGGVDCVHLQHAVHFEAGAFPQPLELPQLPMDWHLSHAESGILDFFHRPEVRERLRHVDRDEPVAHGDLVPFRVGLGVHHLASAIATSGGMRLLFIPRGACARLWPLEHPQLRRAAIWRITE